MMTFLSLMISSARSRSHVRPALAGLAALACGLASGCMVSVSSSATDGGVQDSTSFGGTTSAGPSDEGRPPSADETGSAEEGTTGNAPDLCVGTPNLLVDPGFERGPDSSWDQSSTLFYSVFCDSTCASEEENYAHGGEWWVWFGGDPRPDVAWVSQRVVIDPDAASLSFHLAVRPAGDTTGDSFSAWVDDVELFRLEPRDFEDSYEYTRFVLDLSRFADGLEHEVAFEARLSGNGYTSFFLDDVSLQNCTEEPSTSSSTTGAPSGEDSGETGGGSGAVEDSGTDATGSVDGSSGAPIADASSGGGTAADEGASADESTGGPMGTETAVGEPASGSEAEETSSVDPGATDTGTAGS